MCHSKSLHEQGQKAARPIFLAIDCFLELCHYTSRHGFTEISEKESGVAPGIFWWGADSSDEGAKLLFLGTFTAKNLRKIVFHLLTVGLACSKGDCSPF